MARKSAPMSSGKAKSGGGIASNKTKKVPLTVGQRRVDAVSPGGVSELGAIVGNNPKSLIDARPQDRTDLGNYLAEQVVCGPGGSRTIYKSGSQDMHGSVKHGEAQRVPDPPATEPTGSFSDQVKPR